MLRKNLKLFIAMSIVTTMLVGCGNAGQTTALNEIGAIDNTQLTGPESTIANDSILDNENNSGKDILNAVVDTEDDDVIKITTDTGEKVEIDTTLETTEVVKNEDGSTTYTTEDGTEVTVKEDGTATVTPAPSEEPETSENTKKEETTSTETTTPEPTETPTPVHSHNYTSKVTKAATCTSNGTRTYTCSCGDSYAEEISKTGHTESGWITVTEATCSADGLKHKTCIVCGAETASEAIASSGNHSYYWDGNNTTRTHKCSGCDYIGVTEYNIGGVWGYFDDNAAAELWDYINGQRNATQTITRDPEGNPIGIVNVQSLIEDIDLMALAKKRAAEVATNFSHGAYGDECLAGGQGTAFEAFSAWYRSEPHIKAITDPDYIYGGIACFWYDADGSGINLYPIWVLEMSRE